MRKKKGFLSKIPVLNYCCLSVPLRPASFIIALLGIIPSIMCIALATPMGNGFLRFYGLPKSYSPLIECIYGVLGAEMCLCTIILLVATIVGIPELIVMYLWIVTVYIAGSFAAGIIVSTEAVRSNHLIFGVTYLLLSMLQVFVSIYFWVVIKSMLFVKKADNNVININITIV